jgi:hypothetical protein
LVAWFLCHCPYQGDLLPFGDLKSQKKQVAQVGEKFSWVAPQDIQRVTATSTDSEVAVEQVKRFAKQNDRLKAVVADSLYGNHYFLASLLGRDQGGVGAAAQQPASVRKPCPQTTQVERTPAGSWPSFQAYGSLEAR